MPVQEKIQTALRMEAAGLDFSPKVAGSMMTIYQDGTVFTYLANSNGIAGWFPSVVLRRRGRDLGGRRRRP